MGLPVTASWSACLSATDCMRGKMSPKPYNAGADAGTLYRCDRNRHRYQRYCCVGTHALDRFTFIWNRLMAPNRFARQGAVRELRCGASGKRRNVAGGRFGPPDGRVFAPSGLRYGPLVDGKSTAGSVALPADVKTRSKRFHMYVKRSKACSAARWHPHH